MSVKPASGQQRILDEVAELTRTELEWHGAVQPEMRLIEDFGLDSIRLLTLAMAVEDHFRICLDENDESSIHTLGDLVATIERKLADSAIPGAPLHPEPVGGADA